MTTDGQMDRRSFIQAAGAIAAGGALAVGIAAYVATRPGAAEKLVAHRHSGPLPIDAPNSEAWLDLDHFPVTMLMQQITPPHPSELAVPELWVRAMHNGTDIAFHLEWGDAVVNDLDKMVAFRDSVAVQLPVAPEADAAAPKTSVTMGLAPTQGAPGQNVHILHWKASWQYDVDKGRRTVKDLFPNMHNDMTPEGVLGEANALVFYPGVFAGNSMSARERKSPIEELTAAGFGSLTTHQKQLAQGRGVNERGRWRVVLSMPMDSGDATKATVRAGASTPVAFAVWNGEKGNRGARKQYANWVPMEVEA